MAAKEFKPGGEINAQDYLQAAQEHAASLASLYHAGAYALTLYVSGLAAECLFRAFRARKGLLFRSDHPLDSLAREAGFPDVISPGHRQRFCTALADLTLRWRNNHRFRSNVAARRFLKDMKLDRGIKGDFLKENARRMFVDAINLISLGVLKWH